MEHLFHRSAIKRMKKGYRKMYVSKIIFFRYRKKIMNSILKDQSP